jgi:hypothetical protein
VHALQAGMRKYSKHLFSKKYKARSVTWCDYLKLKTAKQNHPVSVVDEPENMHIILIMKAKLQSQGQR